MTIALAETGRADRDRIKLSRPLRLLAMSGVSIALWAAIILPLV